MQKIVDPKGLMAPTQKCYVCIQCVMEISRSKRNSVWSPVAHIFSCETPSSGNVFGNVPRYNEPAGKLLWTPEGMSRVGRPNL